MSGVATTLIEGETLQCETKFYMENITSENQDEWKQICLVIIDEISFASKNELMTLDNKMHHLKQ